MALGSKLLIITLLVCTAICILACSTTRLAETPTSITHHIDSNPDLLPTPTPVDPWAIIRASGNAMEILHSFHFHLKHEEGHTPLPLLLGLGLEEAEGDVIKPDKLSVDFGGTLGNTYIKSSLITIGSSSFVTNPLTGQWEKLGIQASPLGFFDPVRGITSIMSQVNQVSLLPDGKDTYRLQAQLPAEALSALLGQTTEETTITAQLTIDTQKYHLLEAVLTGKATPGEPHGTVRTIKLSRFDEPVNIEFPQ